MFDLKKRIQVHSYTVYWFHFTWRNNIILHDQYNWFNGTMFSVWCGLKVSWIKRGFTAGNFNWLLSSLSLRVNLYNVILLEWQYQLGRGGSRQEDSLISVNVCLTISEFVWQYKIQNASCLYGNFRPKVLQFCNRDTESEKDKVSRIQRWLKSEEIINLRST